MSMTTEALAGEIFTMVADVNGDGLYRPQDIFKEMTLKFKDEGVKKKDCKEALKTLIESEKLTYTVLNGSCTSMVGLPGCEDQNVEKCPAPSS